jgi:PAS domain S-box-containing protein
MKEEIKAKKAVRSKTAPQSFAVSKLTEEAFFKTEAEYRTIFDNTGTILVLIGEDGVIKLVNREIENILGYQKEEVEKRFKWTDLVHPDDIGWLAKIRQARLKGDKSAPRNYEFRARTKNGEYKFLYATVSAMPGNKEFLVSLLDLSEKKKNEKQAVSERKKAQEEKRQSAEQYRLIFESSPDVIVMLDNKGLILEVNQLVETWLKYKRNDVIGKKLLDLDFLPESSKRIIREKMRLRFTGQEIEPYELEFLGKKGEIKYGLIKGSLVKDELGKGLKDLVIISDITKQKKITDELKKEEENFKNIVEKQLNAVVIVDWKGKIVFANQAFVVLGSYSGKEKVVGKNIFSYIHPDSRMKVIKDMSRTAKGQGGYVAEYKVLDNFKNIKIIESIGDRIIFEGGEKFIVSIRDITESKKIENELRQSEEKYRSLFNSMKDGIVMVDMAGKIIDCNQAYLDMLGYSKEELLKLTYKQFTPARWEKIEADIVKNKIIAKGYSDEYEKEYIRKDGQIILVALNTWLIKDASGKPEGMWATVRDMTIKRKNEEALRLEKDLAQKYFDVSATILMVLGLDQEVKQINKKGLEILGYKEVEVIGKNWFDNFLPIEIREDYRKKFIGLIKDPGYDAGKYFPDDLSHLVVGKKGINRLIEWHTSIIKDEKGALTGILSSGVDITDKKKSESELKEKFYELERINKLMVGREMKMIELKEKIKELEDELAQKN